MRANVVRAFPYSLDGINTLYAEVNKGIDLPEAMVKSLMSEGFLSEVVGGKPSKPIVGDEVHISPTDNIPAPSGIAVAEGIKPQVTGDAAPDVAIPENWRTAKWFTLKSLAQKIAGRDVADSDDARGVIEAELARRAAA